MREWGEQAAEQNQHGVHLQPPQPHRSNTKRQHDTNKPLRSNLFVFIHARLLIESSGISTQNTYHTTLPPPIPQPTSVLRLNPKPFKRLPPAQNKHDIIQPNPLLLPSKLQPKIMIDVFPSLLALWPAIDDLPDLLHQTISIPLLRLEIRQQLAAFYNVSGRVRGERGGLSGL